MQKTVNVAITGAAGQIGYALLFRLASGQIFGPDTAVRLQLLELEAALPSLRGVKMELEDCAFPLVKDVICTADVNEAMRDANYVILVGSVPRKQGMERADLLKINGGIFSVQGKAINDNAASDVKVFVVGNPCNTNCLIAMHHAPDVPKDRFFAMTKLDENRARMQLALKAGVSVKEVTNMTIWGNHSTTQYPDFYHAKIAGRPVTEVIPDLNWLENEFVPLIQKRGAAVINARGASSAASAANAVVDWVHCHVNDTPAGDSFSVAVCSHGEYGIDEGLFYSIPCRTENGVLKRITTVAHNEFGKQKILLGLEELRAEAEAVKALGLI